MLNKYIKCIIVGIVQKVNFSKYQVKDLDVEKGLVSFYFSHFGNNDRDLDIITEDAFDSIIAKKDLNKLRHFRNHNKTEAAGAVLDINKDEKGAYVISQLAIKTIVGLDTYEQYKAGIIKEHSFGYDVIDFEKKQDGGRVLKSLDVWEVSSLTHWGANDRTPVRSIKSLFDAETYLDELIHYLDSTDLNEVKAKEITNRIDLIKSKLESKSNRDSINISFIDYKCISDLLTNKYLKNE